MHGQNHLKSILIYCQSLLNTILVDYNVEVRTKYQTRQAMCATVVVVEKQ